MGNAHKKTTASAVKKMLNLGPLQAKENERFEVPSDPLTETMIRVKITDVVPYDLNLRIRKNAKYEEIKESIQTRGLDQPFSITRKPGDANYTIARGGNTRLSILQELNAQTSDDRYLWQELKFIPWKGERTALIGHLVENDLRADFTFYERARGVVLIRNEICAERDDSKPPSLSELSKYLSKRGYNVDRSTLSRMIYAVEELYPAIPLALNAGLGGSNIRKIRQLCNGAISVMVHSGRTDSQRNHAVIGSALESSDSKTWSTDTFTENLVTHVSRELNVDRRQVQLAIRGSMGGAPLDDILSDDSTSSGIKTPTNRGPSERSRKSSPTIKALPTIRSSLETLRLTHLSNAQLLAGLVKQSELVQPLHKPGFGYLVLDFPLLGRQRHFKTIDRDVALRVEAVWFHLVNLSGMLVALEDNRVCSQVAGLLPEDSLLKGALQQKSMSALSEVTNVFQSPGLWSYSLVGLLTTDEWQAVSRLHKSFRALVSELGDWHNAWALMESKG